MMNIQCQHCNTNNPSDAIFCIQCSNPVCDKDTIIKKLYGRLNTLEHKYQEDIKSLKKDIFKLEQTSFSTTKTQTITPNKTVVIKEEIKKEKVEITQENQVLKTENKRTHPSKIEIKKEKTLKPEEKSVFILHLEKYLAPINDGIDLFLKAYNKYKEERKLPIFFMTIAGTLAILFGFGYLMQKTFDYIGIYEIVVKISFGFIFSTALCWIGIRLSKKQTTLQEYGSALISLGILLNYLFIYFMSDMGNFPVLSSGLVGFCLIGINTIISIYFSLKYNAKIISVISLIGGAYTPLYLNAMGDGTFYYLYLWFLTLATCYIANKKSWIKLNYIAFVVITASMEFMVFNQKPSDYIYTLYYHLFAYLFLYISLFDRIQLKRKFEKPDIIILSSSISFFLYNLYSLFENNLVYLGIIYAINGLVFASLLFKKWKMITRDTKLILLLITGVFIGFAIPSIFEQKLIGLFWSIEALLFVILGFKYALPTVRKEGYLLLLIAFGKLLFHSTIIIELFDTTIYHQGLLNYISFGIVLAIMWVIGKRHIKNLVGFEIRLFNYIQEVFPIWLSSIYFIIGFYFIDDWILNLSLIPLFGFIYWKEYFKTKYTDYLGLSHITLLLFNFIYSAINNNSLHFSDQTLSAQVALIEFLACLWVLKLYYSKLNLENRPIFNFTHNLRIAFFCILPLTLVSIVRRNAFEYIEIALWFGSLLTYFLFKKLDFKALKIEFYILTIISLYFGYFEWDSFGFIAGIIVSMLILLLEKSTDYETVKKSVFRQYLTIIPFTTVALMGSLIFSIDHDFLTLSFSIPSLLLLTLAYYYDKIGFIRDSVKLTMNLGLIANLLSLLALVFEESILSGIISAVNLTLYCFLLNNKKKWFPITYGKSWNYAIVFHQIECIIIIAFILVFFNIDLDGPVTSISLAIHAIILLFVAMKNQIKILNKISLTLFALTLFKVIFNDIKDFDTTQKIIVLIILGIILLAASYGYVKLSNYFKKNIDSKTDLV